MKARTWIAHVLVDVSAIAAIAAMALTRIISGEWALAAILVVQGAYVAQFRRPPPGGPPGPPVPVGLILPMLDPVFDLIRRWRA